MFCDFLKRYSPSYRRGQHGFTLIEIMVVIAILGILLAIALPNFTSTIRRFRTDGIRDDITASLRFARSEAIRTGSPITVRRIPASATCSANTAIAGTWDCGWQVLDNTNAVIQQSTVPSGFSVTETSAIAADSVVANRWGQFSSTSRLIVAPIISGTATASDPSANALCLGTGGKLTNVKHSTGSVTC
jgi:type IV fimbrial biogenesis protein FimT